MKRKKGPKWRGVFNFSRQVVIKYLHAHSKAQAKIFMMRRIAKEHNVPYSYVFGEFDGSKDNYLIEEVKENEN